jgi:hypothetical protein
MSDAPRDVRPPACRINCVYSFPNAAIADSRSEAVMELLLRMHYSKMIHEPGQCFGDDLETGFSIDVPKPDAHAALPSSARDDECRDDDSGRSAELHRKT